MKISMTVSLLLMLFVSGCTSMDYLELTEQEYLLVGQKFPTCAYEGSLPSHSEEGFHFLRRHYKGDPKQNCNRYLKYLQILKHTTVDSERDQLMTLNDIDISDYEWRHTKGPTAKHPGIYKTDSYGNPVGPPILVIK